MDRDLEKAFRDQVSQPDGQIDLFLAALLIAGDEYSELDPDHYVTQIDSWVKHIERKLPRGASSQSKVIALNLYLFGELGFRGNTWDYSDPRNSYLNEVVERRTGIPITLSVLYMELGRRLELVLEGVSFPGHFLVKLTFEAGELILDPFNGGVALDENDLIERLRSIFNKEIDDVTPFLGPATNKDILVRMLSNLKSIYQQREDKERALGVVNKILTVNPALSDQYRDRGLLLNSLECYNAALKDLQSYLHARPEADDVEAIRKLVIGLQEQHSRLN